jgi:hypothetical protein
MVGNVSGYRKLSDEELALVNKIKATGLDLAELVFEVNALVKARTEQYGTPDAEHYRWSAIGRTDLQTGLMALIRAVAAPSGF